jgi:dihydrofolate synthase/folylpolyglutamate synthase
MADARLDLGLERMHAVVAALGHPEAAFPAVHVAGTNGKGSVCALLSAALGDAGYAVGRFVSPFLCEPRDAVTVRGAPVGEADWKGACSAVLDAATPLCDSPLTTFELWTCAAFLLFAAAKVDVAVVEVGLGGSMDATNVLPTPAVSVITALGMDHMAQLGPTIRHIAKAKAGILKRGGRAVLALQADREAREEVLACARSVGVSLLIEARPLAPAPPSASHGPRSLTQDDMGQWGLAEDGEMVRVPLAGPAQLANAGTALAVLRVLRGDYKGAEVGGAVRICSQPEAGVEHAGPPVDPLRLQQLGRPIGSGFERAAWPGRMEVVALPCGGEGGTVSALLDGGHNEAALPHIAASLRAACAVQGTGAIHLVYACGASRDAKGMFGLLVSLLGAGGGEAPPVRVASVSCVPYSTPQGMPWAAATEPDALVAAVRGSVEEGVPVSPRGCLREAVEGLGGVDGAVAVLGSLYLVSDTHRWTRSFRRPLGSAV